MLNANKMNKRQLINQTKLINVIFILYLNCICSIIAIKQTDNKQDSNKINSNLDKNFQKNLDDLFTLLNNTSINIETYTYNTSDVSNPNSNPVTVRSYDTSYYNLSKHLEQSLNNSNILKKNNRFKYYADASQIPYYYQNSSIVHNTTSESQFNISNFKQVNHDLIDDTSAQMRKILTDQKINITVNTTVNTTTTRSISKLDKDYLDLKLNNITNRTNSTNTTVSLAKLVLDKIIPENLTKLKANITLNIKSNSNSNSTIKENTVSPPIVLSCRNNCTSKGICVQGDCFCAQGFTSEDCSITYEDDIKKGFKFQPYVKWLIITFFVAFVPTAGILTWVFFKKTRAGDYLELD